RIIDLVPEFRFVWWGFAPTDNLRVRLEQTDELVSGRNAFPVQHAPHRLLNHLLDQCQELVQVLDEARRAWIRPSGQGGCDLARLIQGRTSDANQFRIRLDDSFFSAGSGARAWHAFWSPASTVRSGACGGARSARGGCKHPAPAVRQRETVLHVGAGG